MISSRRRIPCSPQSAPLFVVLESSTNCEGSFRERPQQNRIDETKDRSVSSDAERHRNDGEGGEAGLLDQLAKAEADILKKFLHKRAKSPSGEMQHGRDRCLPSLSRL